jgi:hypothetical protein
MEAAKRFFQQAVDRVGHAPERVTTDGHDSYPCAIGETLGSDVIHRCNRSLNHRLEQDHRGIKERYYPMRGFGSVTSASRFCRAFEEVCQCFRVRTTLQQVSLVHQREMFHQRLDALKALVAMASPHTSMREEHEHIVLALAFSVLTHPAIYRFSGFRLLRADGSREPSECCRFHHRNPMIDHNST